MRHKLTFIKTFLENTDLPDHPTYAVNALGTQTILFNGTTTFLKDGRKFNLVAIHLLSQIDGEHGPATIGHMWVSVHRTYHTSM